jgi:hypothetical protein
MIINTIFQLFILAYFATILAYTYSIDGCKCATRKWYFKYIRYYSMAMIISMVLLILLLFVALYVFMKYVSNDDTMTTFTYTIKYTSLLYVLFLVVGNSVYIYALSEYQNFVEGIPSNSDKCNCVYKKFYDVARILSYIYIVLLIVNCIYFFVVNVLGVNPTLKKKSSSANNKIL